MDPLRSELVLARLHVATRQARGSLNQQAIAAIENALLDIRGKEADWHDRPTPTRCPSFLTGSGWRPAASTP
jgi:hypothetical protein